MPEPVKRQPPLSIRLSESERAALTGLAGGLAISTYVKSVLFDAEGPKVPRVTAIDRNLLARVLAQLGSTRAAESLRLLADAAETGSLVADDVTTAKLCEAAEAMLEMRDMLRAALSGRSAATKPAPPPSMALDDLFNSLNGMWRADE